SRPRPGLLHARRPSPVSPLRPRVVPRSLRPGWKAEVGPARAARRRRREGVRARARQSRARRLHGARGRQRGRGSLRDRGGEAGPRAARRDDAADRRLGDAPQDPGAVRRRCDPGRDVQRPGGRGRARAGHDERCTGVRREAVRSAAAHRADEADRTRLTAWDKRAERWIVQHRWHPLNEVFVWLSKIGSYGLVWLVLGVVRSIAWRRWQPFALVLAADAVAEGVTALLKLAFGVHRPAEPGDLLGVPHSRSFPSGHTATSFACATVIAVLVPRAAPFVY